MEPILFDILPPPATWSDEKVDRWCLEVGDLLKREGIHHITVPEIVQETRDTERSVAFIPKLDNMHFSGMLKKRLDSIISIPNKICVRLTQCQFADWVAHVYSIGVRHIVLVGGEHTSSSYPGYSVVEATRFVKSHYPDMKVGGITIFTRKGEAKRLFDKMNAGMDFFLSQIVFESANMKQIVLSLSNLCQKANQAMPKIYLSVALASKIRDIEFLKWLGVEFPSAVHSYLIEGDENMVAERSLQAMDMLLDDVFYLMDREKIDLGFNVEHVMYTNLNLSAKLYKDIKERIMVKKV